LRFLLYSYTDASITGMGEYWKRIKVPLEGGGSDPKFLVAN